MVSTIEKIEEKLKDNNINDNNFYRIVLEYIESIIASSISLMSREDKEKIRLIITQKVDELGHQKELYVKSNTNFEEIFKLSGVIEKLKKYEKIIESDIITTNPNLMDFKLSLIEELKLRLIGNKSNIVYSYGNRLECDYSALKELIEIDSNPILKKELEGYHYLLKTIDDIQKLINEKKYLLNELKTFLSLENIIIIYRKIILEYYDNLFEYQKISNERKQLFSQSRRYSKSNNKIQVLGEKLALITLNMKSLIERLNFLINNMENDYLRNIFRYNKDILITLGKVPCYYDPFTKTDLDYTFADLNDKYCYSDMLYFIGSNVHNFNKNNLMDAIEYLEKMISLLEKRLDYLNNCKKHSLRNSSKKALSIIFKKYSLIDTYCYLKEKDNNKVSSIALIYGIDALNVKKYDYFEISSLLLSCEKYLVYDNIYIQSIQLKKENHQ